MGNGIILQMQKFRTIISTAIVDVIQMNIPIDDLAYITELTTNLLSVSFFHPKGLNVTLQTDKDGTGMAF